jgi:hypothetical protein
MAVMENHEITDSILPDEVTGAEHSPDGEDVESLDRGQGGKVSRRKFLRLAGGAAITTIAAATLGGSVPRGPENKRAERDYSPEIVISTRLELIPNSYIDLSEPERVQAISGRLFYPDGRVPFATVGGEKYAWVSCGPETYRYPISDTGQIAESPSPRIPAAGPGSEFYNNGYVGITSVFQQEPGKPENLLALAHFEQHGTGGSRNFTASVGLLRSSNGGKTFIDEEAIIKGVNPDMPGKRVSGAGQPCGVLKDTESLYIYYTDWVGDRADQIYLSKVNPKDPELKPLYWDGSQFVESISASAPVFSPPGNAETTKYAALPSISFNTELGVYLATFETDIGVYISSSDDLITWEKPEMLVRYPHSLSSVWAGEARDSYSYPTLLSFSEKNDRTTNSRVSLVLASGVGSSVSHRISRLEGKIK